MTAAVLASSEVYESAADQSSIQSSIQSSCSAAAPTATHTTPGYMRTMVATVERSRAVVFVRPARVGHMSVRPV